MTNDIPPHDDPLADPEEQRVLMAALDSYDSYQQKAHYNVTHIRRQSFYALPQEHWTLLSKPPFSILDTFNAVDDAIDANAAIAKAIVAAAKESFLPPGFGLSGNTAPPENTPPWAGKSNSNDLEKARSTLRQFYRDWSAEGSSERDACYGPILDALSSEHGAVPNSEKAQINVLVPGAGLGRLLLEIVLHGFSAEGNEISYHQLLASSFILNHTTASDSLALYPWALSFSNHISRENQMQKVLIPDVHAGTALAQAIAEGKQGEMGFSTGDFCVVYNRPENAGSFDAVASVFFIDTAPNSIRYIEAVRNCLRPGGIWINLGPLLWHFENNPPGAFFKRGDNDDEEDKVTSTEEGIGEAGAIQLTDEEVVRLVEHMGFTIEKHEVGKAASGYIQDPRSMLQNTYIPSFWIARKK